MVGHQVDLGVEELLLGVEHIQQRALSHPLLLAHAGERDAVGRHCGGVRFHCRLRRLQLRPRRHHLRLHLRARLLDLLQALDVRVLGLAHACLHLAAGVERHRHPAGDQGRFRPVDQRRRIEALGVVGLQLHGRQQLAPDRVDGEARALLAVERCHHVRAFTDGDFHVLLQGPRHQVALPRLHQMARRMADDALEGGAAGLEVGPGKIEGRHGGGAARLRLGDVGARHLADVEAVLRRPQIAGEDGHVVLAQAHDRRVAHDVAVGRHGLQQHRCLGNTQGFPPGARRRLRGIDRAHRAEAAKQRLHQAHGIAARVELGRGAVGARRDPNR